MTATPSSGHVFTGWSGGGCVGTGTCSLTVVANTSVTAGFEPAQCTFTFVPTANTLSAAAGSDSVAVTASKSTCTRTATSNVTWLTITAGGTGTGNGTVSYSVTANDSTSPRTGIITIGGQSFTVTQAGVQQYVLTATKAGTCSGTVSTSDNKINCGATCTATYDSGTSVYFSAVPDSGCVFTGWSGGTCSGSITCNPIVSANATVTATFEPSACTSTVSPVYANPSAASSSGTLTVTPSTPLCTWTAVSNAPWITIAAGATGTGAGTVIYTVADNPSYTSRTGTISVAGRTITIIQSAAQSAPTLTLVAPQEIAVGTASQVVTLTGTNFFDKTEVYVGTTKKAITLINSKQLQITLTSADLSTQGTFAVKVINPPPMGGTSAELPLVVSGRWTSS